MKKQAIIFVITILCLTFFGCEAMATLFHGPKPEEPPVTYTVTFNANGASGTVPEKQTVNAGTVINLPDKGNLSKVKNYFDGWYTNATSTETNYAAGSSYTVNGNVTLYAKWTEEDTSCTVIFNINGGSGTTPAIQTVNAGTVITLPNGSGFSKTGYTSAFGGWNTNANGMGANYNSDASYTVTGNVTLYARWRPYELGDTGPGGGMIFYRSEKGFTHYTGTGYTTLLCHYLEAAPANMPGLFIWATPPYTSTSIQDTGTAIGTGRKNTELILAKNADAPAAKVCKEYNNMGKTDWFLPSKDELSHFSRDHIGNLESGFYWSSSEDSTHRAWNLNLGTDSSGGHANQGKLLDSCVRAIRAF
jgi:uncharacterized repeat protein (TIGR02543 family)